jgi:hypothetical protein
MSKDISNINKDIIRSLLTTEDANLLLSFLDQQKKNAYFTHPEPFIKSCQHSLPHRLSMPLLRITEEYNPTNLEEQEAFFSTLYEEIAACPILTLTLAIYPTENTIQHIASFIKEQISYRTILEIVTDKTILGGAVIIYNGRFTDNSLQKKLQEYFVKSEKDILNFFTK